MAAPAQATPIPSARKGIQDFAYGCLGALLPVVVNAQGLLFAENAAYEKNLQQMIRSFQGNPVFFTVMVFLYIICAGLFAKAWKPESEYKALWVGASFAALVANIHLNLPVK